MPTLTEQELPYIHLIFVDDDLIPDCQLATVHKGDVIIGKVRLVCWQWPFPEEYGLGYNVLRALGEVMAAAEALDIVLLAEPCALGAALAKRGLALRHHGGRRRRLVGDFKPFKAFEGHRGRIQDSGVRIQENGSVTTLELTPIRGPASCPVIRTISVILLECRCLSRCRQPATLNSRLATAVTPPVARGVGPTRAGR